MVDRESEREKEDEDEREKEDEDERGYRYTNAVVMAAFLSAIVLNRSFVRRFYYLLF